MKRNQIFTNNFYWKKLNNIVSKTIRKSKDLCTFLKTSLKMQINFLIGETKSNSFTRRGLSHFLTSFNQFGEKDRFEAEARRNPFSRNLLLSTVRSRLCPNHRHHPECLVVFFKPSILTVYRNHRHLPLSLYYTHKFVVLVVQLVNRVLLALSSTNSNCLVEKVISEAMITE